MVLYGNFDHNNHNFSSPISVILADYVEDIPFPEVKACLLARDVWVAEGKVVKVSPHSHLALSHSKPTLRRNQLERYSAF